VPTEQVFRAAVIGLGSIARRIHLPILAANERVEVVGALARRPGTVAELARCYNLGQPFTSLDELIRSGPDVAFVFTPKETHREIAIRLLREGIDVYCEKPMATTLRGGEEMVEVARETRRVLMIGFNRRFAPAYARAHAVTRESGVDVCLAEKNRPQTEYRATLENAIHMVDLLRWFGGEAQEVSAFSQHVDPYYETSVTAQIRFDSGALGVLIANRSAGQWLERMEVYGGNRTTLVEAPERVTVQYAEQEVSTAETPLDFGWAGAASRLGFRQAIDHFLDSVRDRTEPLTSPADAFQTHVLMDRILRSCGLPALDEEVAP
jgi:virulence factor